MKRVSTEPSTLHLTAWSKAHNNLLLRMRTEIAD